MLLWLLLRRTPHCHGCPCRPPRSSTLVRPPTAAARRMILCQSRFLIQEAGGRAPAVIMAWSIGTVSSWQIRGQSERRHHHLSNQKGDPSTQAAHNNPPPLSSHRRFALCSSSGEAPVGRCSCASIAFGKTCVRIPPKQSARRTAKFNHAGLSLALSSLAHPCQPTKCRVGVLP